MDPKVGLIQGLEALADMIGNSIQAPMEGHEAEGRGEHARGMSGSGVSVEVVTPIESFHQFYRYSYIWHFPDGSSWGVPRSASRRRTDGLASSPPGLRRIASPSPRPHGIDLRGRTGSGGDGEVGDRHENGETSHLPAASVPLRQVMHAHGGLSRSGSRSGG